MYGNFENFSLILQLRMLERVADPTDKVFGNAWVNIDSVASKIPGWKTITLLIYNEEMREINVLAVYDVKV